MHKRNSEVSFTASLDGRCVLHVAHWEPCGHFGSESHGKRWSDLVRVSPVTRRLLDVYMWRHLKIFFHRCENHVMHFFFFFPLCGVYGLGAHRTLRKCKAVYSEYELFTEAL